MMPLSRSERKSIMRCVGVSTKNAGASTSATRRCSRKIPARDFSGGGSDDRTDTIVAVAALRDALEERQERRRHRHGADPLVRLRRGDGLRALIEGAGDLHLTRRKVEILYA